MVTGNNVGINPSNSLTQGVANYTVDLDGGTYTAADLIALAVADGTQMIFDDGTSRVVAATDFIARIDADLKPIGGHGNIGGAQVTSTTSDATFQAGSSVTDIDGGGSRAVGATKSASGFFIRSNFNEIVVQAGSIVTVAMDLSHVPA